MPDVEYGSSLALPFVNSDVLTVYRVREGVNLRFWATDAKNLQPILNRALLEPNDNVFCSTDNILLPFRKVRQRFLSNFFCAPETTGELTDPITGLEWQYLIRSLGCLRLDAKEREAAYDLLQALSMYVTGHYSRSTVLQCFPSLNPCDQVFSASLSSSSSSVCSLASDIKLDASVARKLLVNYVLATPYLVRLFSVPADFWMKMGAEIPHFLLRGVAPLLHLFQVVSSMTEVPIVIDLQQTVIHGCTFDLTAVCSTVAPFCELGIYRAAQGLRRAMSHIKEQFFKLCLAMPQCIRTEADQTASLPRCCSMIHEADFDKACNLIEHFGMIAPYLTSLCRNEKDLPSVQYLPMIEALNLTTYSAHAKVWATSPFIPDVLSFLYHDFSDSGTFLFASYLLCLRCLTRPDMHHYLRPDWLPYQLDLFHAAAKEIMEVHYPNGAPSHQTDDEAWPGSSLVFQFIHHCYIVRQGRHVSLVELLYDLLCFEFINPSDDLTPEKIIDGLADLKLQNWLNICTCRADVLRPFLADPNFFALADRDPFLKEFGDLCLAYVNEYKLINELERQKEPADDNIRSFLITDVDPPLNKSNDVIVFCHGPAEEFYVSQAFFKELIHRRYGIPFGKDAPLEKMIQMFRQERDQWCTRLAVVSPAAITHAANAASTEMQSSVSCSSNKKRKGSEASTSSKRQKTDGEKKKPGRKPQIAILKEELRKAQAALRDLQQNQKKTPEGLPIELELHKAELERRLREQLAKHETGLRKESETLQVKSS